LSIPFTFGIVTGGGAEAMGRVHAMIDSIERERIPEYEVVVVGGEAVSRSRTRHVPFDESQKPKWITRKKNIVTESASYENVVYMHDYLALEPGWYEGWLRFGDGFKACMNRILNADGTRFRDWCLAPDETARPARKRAGMLTKQNILPYCEGSLSKFMYFSGSYWVAKRAVMREFPLDERLCWGEREDVVWSHQFRNKYDFSMNQMPAVRVFGKQKESFWTPMSQAQLEAFKKFVSVNPVKPGYGCFPPFWTSQES
jgi:hypothetical protein